jgi:hypothetical protein
MIDIDYQKVTLSNGSRFFTPSFRCLVWLSNEGSNFDKNVSVLINYPAKGTTGAQTLTIASPVTFNTAVYGLQSGDQVELTTDGSTNIVLFYIRLPDQP